jgi:hypothetical protein
MAENEDILKEWNRMATAAAATIERWFADFAERGESAFHELQDRQTAWAKTIARAQQPRSAI